MLTICVVVFMLLVVVHLIFSYCGMDKIDFKEVGANNIDKTDIVLKKMPKGTTHTYSTVIFM